MIDYPCTNAENQQSDIPKQGIPVAPDGYGKNTGECGDTVEISIHVCGDDIQEMGCRTDGCSATRLCAATVVQLARGMDIHDAWSIRPEHIMALLEDLPPDHFHCAELAAGALYRALIDLQNNRKKPWAKFYRTGPSLR